MLAAFFTTLEQMARILLFLVVGFGLNRLHVLPKGAGVGTSKLVTMVFLPALVIHSNMTEFNLADVASYGRLVLLGCLLWTVVTLLVLPVARKLSNGSREERGVYLYGLSFPNTGAVGVPMSLALLGTAGLFQFNLFALFLTIMTYAWGVGLFLEVERKNPIKRFFIHMFNPVFIAMMIGLLLCVWGAKNWMPRLVTNFIGDLSSCFVPVSLILTGYMIAEYPLSAVFNRPKSYLFTFLRLLAIPGLVLVIAWCMGLSKSLATLAVLAFAGPSGMNVVLFPASYGRDCKTGASIVLLSSVGSVLTVPFLYALVQEFFT